MKKIPVLDTIRFAYSYTFTHLGTIIGLIWVPMVILAVPGYFVTSYYYSAVPDALAVGDVATVGRAGLLVIVWGLVSLLISSIMYVAVTQHALELREGQVIAHFALGPAEFRVFGAALAVAALALLFATVDGALADAVRSLMGPSGAATAEFVALAGVLAIVYAVIRLSFLLVPATVVEEKVGLGRAWELSSGNFWRIVAVGVASLGPIVVLSVLGEALILGSGATAHAASAAGNNAQQMQQMANQMRVAARNLPLLYGLSFVISPLVLGLALAPAAFAYRVLTGAETGGPVS